MTNPDTIAVIVGEMRVLANFGDPKLVPDALHLLADRLATLGDVEKDAARYRWLRDSYDPSVHDDEDQSFLAQSAEDLDSAIDDYIDAAMRQEGGTP